MEITNEIDPLNNGVTGNDLPSGKRARVLASRDHNDPKEKNLKKLAKRNNLRETIIVDVIDEDIFRADTISEEELESYNKDYEEFMKRGRTPMPTYPVQKIMVTNIQDYLKFSKDNHPAMVYFSDDLKIPLLTLDNGSEVRPHSDSIGIYYILEGRGTIKVGMKNYAINQGSLIHVPKGVIRSIHCEDALKIMAVHIS